MTLAPELKEILRLPEVQGAARVPRGGGRDPLRRCRLAFAIDEGIPVMLLEEARPLGPSASKSGSVLARLRLTLQGLAATVRRFRRPSSPGAAG